MLSEFDLLLFLAESFGLNGSFKVSTKEIASLLGVSQQTVSRKLREMERKGLIERNASVSGVSGSVTVKGKSLLRENFAALDSLFREQPSFIKGKVASGIGEGAYYVNQYRNAIRKALGITPFLGTLNLEVKRLDFLKFISGLRPKEIPGFKTRERSFGWLKCYSVSVKGISAFLVIPERTRHSENIVELISSVNLRKRFGLKDNETVTISKGGK